MSKNSVGNVSMDLTLNKGNFNRMIKSAAGEADNAFSAAMGKIKDM